MTRISKIIRIIEATLAEKLNPTSPVIIDGLVDQSDGQE